MHYIHESCLTPSGHVPGADLGPVISPLAKDRILELVQSGINEGAKIELDGRNLVVKGYEKGNFVGPTILSGVQVSIPLSLSRDLCKL